MSNGTMPIVIVAQDEDEAVAIHACLKGKRGARLITVEVET